MKTPALALIFLGLTVAAAAQNAVGIFEAHGDVGENPKSGSVEFNPATGEYHVTGGGANMWSTTDAFQFVWKRLSGDVTLSADVQFIGAGKVGHRKAVLMMRQSLEAGAAYADVALHGDGLTSLQFRAAAGAETEEVRAVANAPRRIRIERRGDQFTMYTAGAGEELKPAGTAAVRLRDPVYVGIGVCSHDADTLETAVFSNVQLTARSTRPADPRARVKSKISVFDLADKSIRVVYETNQVFEAPNWSPDGKYLLSNSGGKLYRINLDETPAQPQKLDLGSLSHCNNDHGISRDGKLLAISASSGSSESRVFLASIDGTNARLMTPKEPSYFHGFSPDGRWLAFVGERDGNFNLFRVAAAGGDEQRLTSRRAYDDGPDYSPDGRWIYFNSNRSGGWDIWRMPADGAGPDDVKAERVTDDEWEDWFPHPSPDAKWLVFLSFPHGTPGHDAETDVVLRLMPLPGEKLAPPAIQPLATIVGGQGTINVNSWSPDSGKFAFVTYELR
jgi:TolB protein